MAIFRYTFGQWVLIDGVTDAQIIDYLGNGWWRVDIGGKWDTVNAERITENPKYN